MTTKRPYYPTKAAWAAAQAETYGRLASELSERIPGTPWRHVRSRETSAIRMRNQQARYLHMAERFHARGV